MVQPARNLSNKIGKFRFGSYIAHNITYSVDDIDNANERKYLWIKKRIKATINLSYGVISFRLLYLKNNFISFILTDGEYL